VPLVHHSAGGWSTHALLRMSLQRKDEAEYTINLSGLDELGCAFLQTAFICGRNSLQTLHCFYDLILFLGLWRTNHKLCNSPAIQSGIL